jgi:regulator of ribonuclease activity A
MPPKATADLCDAHAEELQVCEPVFQAFGGRPAFAGAVSTVRCFEDNSRVKEAAGARCSAATSGWPP